MMDIVFEVLKDESKYPRTWNNLGEQLLCNSKKNSIKRDKQYKWIKRFLFNNSKDLKSMKILFNVICNCSKEQRIKAIVSFCSYNKSYDAFKAIQLIPTHGGWHGSEIPVLEKRISYLEQLKNELNGYDYIQHRARISEYIQNARERKNKVLTEEFLQNK